MTVRGSPPMVAGVELEMLRPESQSGRHHDVLVVADDVHLGVVEQGVLVQVRRADREPAVVDDSDLRMDVDGIGEAAVACVERAREQAATSVVGVDQLSECAASVVSPGVRFHGQDENDPERVIGGFFELVAQDFHDLG